MQRKIALACDVSLSLLTFFSVDIIVLFGDLCDAEEGNYVLNLVNHIKSCFLQIK